jgi:RHS repeat-associated protein
VTYEYTPTDKVSRIRPPRSGDIEFAYDVLDNCVSMTDWVGTTRYEHDANGSVTSVSDPHGFTVKCAYDAAGNPVAVTYPDGKLVTYGYDELRRLTAVTNWLGQVATWEYDGGARLFQARGFNGTTTKYSWDEVNRLIALENRRGDGQLIALYRFGLDQDGNRTNLVRSEPLYPGALGQTTAYAYDAQRVRLLEAGGRQFTWDGEGQLLRKDNVTFGFDELHRLVSVSGPVALRFAYDGAHHRLEATRGGVATRYVYDPLGRVIAEADSANKITRYYIWGAGLLALAMPSGEVYTYHFDPNGSTVALTDQSQSSICLYSYSPFGEVTAEQETVPQPFRFVGQHGVWAEANGLYQMGARYYDAPIGRFISQDPAGVEATGPNLYAYAGNNPISNIDPTGRSSLIAAGTKVLIAEIAVVTGLAAEVARSGDQFTWQKGVEVGASTVAGVGVGLAVTGLTLNPVLGAVAGAATAELTGQVIQTCNGERTNFDFASYGMAVGVAAIPLPGVGSLGAIEKQIFTKLALDQIHYMLPSTAAKIVLAEALPALFGEGAKSIFQKTTKGK